MTTKPALKKTNNDEDVQRAKQAFLIALLDISWRLASVFLAPLFIGYIIDQINNSTNYTVIGLIVGILFGLLFIIKQGLDATKTKAGKS